MTTIEAILLGIVQGLTEFLPVSSSGHLKLAQLLFGYENLNAYLFFDLVCHLGTLCAILTFFFSKLRLILLYDRQRVYQVILGTLPLFPIALLLKPIEEIFNTPSLLGFFFLFTAGVLYTGIRFGKKASNPEKPYSDAIKIGLFQALAILPGVSRSGSTISAARLLGWKMNDAILFSFLLAIPAVLGGVALILLKGMMTGFVSQVSFMQYFTGYITSFGVGYFALWWLTVLAAREKLMIFVWYCLIIGLLTLINIS